MKIILLVAQRKKKGVKWALRERTHRITIHTSRRAK
jgi:hypothetical protein